MEEEKFYTLLTDIGKAKVANSIGFGTKINFTKMKVGDGDGAYYNPSEKQTELKNVVWEGAINHVEVDQDNPNYINVEVMLPANVGGFYIREYGAYDDEDNLIGICKCPESYKPKVTNGGAKELLLILTLCVVNTDAVELKIDPTIIFAKKQEIETLRTEVITQLKDLMQDSYPIVEATGVNSYTGSSARIKSVGKGTRCTLFVGTASTGNCSLNLNESGTVAIKDSNGNVVTNLKANIPYNLCHNGSDFILQGKGGGGNLIAKYLLSGYYGEGDNGRVDGAMVNRGAPTANLNCGGTYNLQEGYYSGGKVTANSLATQMANNGVTLTSATQLVSGIKAISKSGVLLTGTGLENIYSGTVTSSSSPKAFTLTQYGGTETITGNLYYLTITGLKKMPTYILGYSQPSGTQASTMYPIVGDKGNIYIYYSSTRHFVKISSVYQNGTLYIPANNKDLNYIVTLFA